MAVWNNLYSTEQLALRVTVCQPSTSCKYFLDIRHTYETEEGDLPSDEGLRIRIQKPGDVTDIGAAIAKILGGAPSAEVGKLHLKRRPRFLLLRLDGKEARFMKIHPAQTKFLYTALSGIGEDMFDFTESETIEHREDVTAWEEYFM